jgi:hypothetical protein
MANLSSHRDEMGERPMDMAVPHNFLKYAAWHRNPKIPISFGKRPFRNANYPLDATRA